MMQSYVETLEDRVVRGAWKVEAYGELGRQSCMESLGERAASRKFN